jgi:hypothetical protein
LDQNLLKACKKIPKILNPEKAKLRVIGGREAAGLLTDDGRIARPPFLLIHPKETNCEMEFPKDADTQPPRSSNTFLGVLLFYPLIPISIQRHTLITVHPF